MAAFDLEVDSEAARQVCGPGLGGTDAVGTDPGTARHGTCQCRRRQCHGVASDKLLVQSLRLTVAGGAGPGCRSRG